LITSPVTAPARRHLCWLAGLALLSACTADESTHASTLHPANAAMSDTPHDAPIPGTWSSPGQMHAYAQAADRFDLHRRLPDYDSAYYDGHRAQLQVVDGDLHVAGNLLLDWERFDGFGCDRWSDILAPDMPGMALLASDEWRWLDRVLFPALAERRQVLRDNLPPSQSQYPQ